eukprot:GHVU01137967.1.p1 GENE.GHVU01137967.1~~GHVU01137967.1.p1  ORF type:complete len:161 (-),score=3.94 GHVU01137967.1:2343-2825(-)
MPAVLSSAVSVRAPDNQQFRPRKLLRARTPTSSILGPSMLISMISMSIINVSFLALLLYLLYYVVGIPSSAAHNMTIHPSQWWALSVRIFYLKHFYLTREGNVFLHTLCIYSAPFKFIQDNIEAASIWVWFTSQLLNAGLIFSFGGKFRKNVLRNSMFMM